MHVAAFQPLVSFDLHILIHSTNYHMWKRYIICYLLQLFLGSLYQETDLGQTARQYDLRAEECMRTCQHTGDVSRKSLEEWYYAGSNEYR